MNQKKGATIDEFSVPFRVSQHCTAVTPEFRTDRGRPFHLGCWHRGAVLKTILEHGYFQYSQIEKLTIEDCTLKID